MQIYDISRLLTAEIGVWPGDTPFQLQSILKINDGSSVNLTTLHVSAHTGAHVDAPLHFLADGDPIDDLDLHPFWGPAQVVTVEKEDGPLTPADLSHVTLTAAPRLLVHSAASHLDPTTFPAKFVYPSPDLAAHLQRAGIVLFGNDGPSMDDQHSKGLPGHKALFEHNIAILEGIDLTGVPDGVYDFVALPLKIAGGDGSPVRAALRSI